MRCRHSLLLRLELPLCLEPLLLLLCLGPPSGLLPLSLDLLLPTTGLSGLHPSQLVMDLLPLTLELMLTSHVIPPTA